jgi:hypothetical protein
MRPAPTWPMTGSANAKRLATTPTRNPMTTAL